MNIISYLFNRLVPSRQDVSLQHVSQQEVSQQHTHFQSVDNILQQLKLAIPGSQLTTDYGRHEMVIRITWKEKGELGAMLPETIQAEASQPAEDTETPLHSTSTDNQEDTVKCETAATRQHQMMQRLIPFFGQNYRFRYNVLTEQTEFAEADSDNFRPVTQRAMNAICMNAFSHDVECWDKDIRRYIESDHVSEHHPFADYLAHLPEWDGVDRVTPLAHRVSRIPIWAPSFHTWMLALTNQWINASATYIDGDPAAISIAPTPYANSVAPILISTRQGLGKSTFCKRLLPAALSRYYTDSYDLNAPSGCEQKLADFGLVNLDEFDKLSVHKMSQLKNLMQMNSLNIRKAYQKSVQPLPRIASFIGTSNRTDLLTDTTGSRRFLCIEVDEMIDNLTPIDYDQLYAQLKQELAEGARCYFTKDEEKRIEQHNRYYYRTSPIEEVLHDHVEFTAPNTEGARLLSAARLFQLLQKKNPAAMRGTTCYALTRLLPTVAEKVHTRYGNGYWVVVKRCQS